MYMCKKKSCMKKTQVYAKALDYLYTQLPMFQRIGAAALKKDLTNTLALMELLGHPHRQFPCIHVAGTNGKGSVSYMLSAILQAHGYKTGLYVSPHYKDFRERIRINGKYITRKAVIEFVAGHRPAFAKISPSFFEITVAMAFDYFAKEQVDIAIIETGLGGRLDSTNVVLPVLSIITNISFDHEQFLGNTLPLIASEKAGIIKPGVPVVIGETQVETKAVFEAKASECQAPIVYADAQYAVRELSETLTHTTFEVQHQSSSSLYEVNLHGPFQRHNVATVLQAVETLGKSGQWPLHEPGIRAGLADVRALTGFMGRWQVLRQNPTILCDSAHNSAGLEIVLKRVQELTYRHLHIVLGVVNDKDLGKILPLFPAEAQYYFAKADIPRGLDADVLQAAASRYGLQGRPYKSVHGALQAARRNADADDLIFVGGSIFTVAEVV